MTMTSYLQWLAQETPTTWWNDSADPDEIKNSLAQGASGITTNPVLAARTLAGIPAFWSDKIGSLKGLDQTTRAERLTRAVVTYCTEKVYDQFDATDQAEGYVCAQVNPMAAGDRRAMMAMARRFAAWAPNIAVKLPVTAAGLDVLEDCIAEGITVTATVSFTVPQVVAVGERHMRGIQRALKAGYVPGHCFAVLMVGRLDNYLREVALDCRADVRDADIQQAGVAVSKNAYRIFCARGYKARLLIAGLRGIHQVTRMAGADIVASIHPRYQSALLDPDAPREPQYQIPVAQDTMDRLMSLDEFVRSYEPDGMAPTDFVRYGAVQRTLSQFDQVGWALLEGMTF